MMMLENCPSRIFSQPRPFDCSSVFAPSRRAMWWQPAYVAGAHRPKQANAAPIYFRIHIEKIGGHRAVSDESHA